MEEERLLLGGNTLPDNSRTKKKNFFFFEHIHEFIHCTQNLLLIVTFWKLRLIQS